MIKKLHNPLWIIALIAVVNALGYGIIIPVLYSYSRKFGLTDFQNGLLFSVYSIFQFLSTPLIGRYSDAYGRRPLLLLSIAGTAVSFFMMAWAPNAAWLFIARALDGITAGNIPVALAVISDTTEAKHRAKGFGIIGASFGFGFTFGPAISAFTLGMGDSMPFIIAGLVGLTAWVATLLFLPETNTHKGPVVSKHLFDFRHLWHALRDPAIGKTLAISFLVILAFSTFVYAFQPIAVKVLGMSTRDISVVFTLIGIVGLVSQAFIIPRAVRRWGERQILVVSVAALAVTFGFLFAVPPFTLFVALTLFQAFANGFTGPVLQALLSRETDAQSQGSIMGVNASYQSIGQILGPLIGGALSTIYLPLPLVASSAAMMLATYLSVKIFRQHRIRSISLV